MIDDLKLKVGEKVFHGDELYVVTQVGKFHYFLSPVGGEKTLVVMRDDAKLHRCWHLGNNEITQDAETCKTCGYTYRLHADATGKDIEAGMVVLAPFVSGGKGDGAQIVKAVVVKIGKPYNVGCGYKQCKLTLAPVDRPGKMTHPLPGNCIIVEG